MAEEVFAVAYFGCDCGFTALRNVQPMAERAAAALVVVLRMFFTLKAAG